MSIRVYLDNCCYNRPYDDQSQLKVHLETEAKLHIQKMITDKKIDLIYSFISEFENSNNPNKYNSRSISDFFNNAAEYVDISHRSDIRSEADEIMKTGIKEMDALQIASAIVGRADYFLTTDKQLLKYPAKKIKIINPIDFIVIMEV